MQSLSQAQIMTTGNAVTVPVSCILQQGPNGQNNGATINVTHPITVNTGQPGQNIQLIIATKSVPQAMPIGSGGHQRVDGTGGGQVVTSGGAQGNEFGTANVITIPVSMAPGGQLQGQNIALPSLQIITADPSMANNGINGPVTMYAMTPSQLNAALGGNQTITLTAAPVQQQQQLQHQQQMQSGGQQTATIAITNSSSKFTHHKRLQLIYNLYE